MMNRMHEIKKDFPQEIQELLELPKEIFKKTPQKGKKANNTASSYSSTRANNSQSSYSSNENHTKKRKV
jgi:hypothetical protein